MSATLNWSKVNKLELDLREAQRRLAVMAARLDQVTAERDRAISTAVKLEQELAEVTP